MKKSLLYLIAIVFAFTLVSCGGNSGEKATNDEGAVTLSGDIKIDGSSTVYPITEAIAEEFRNEASKVKVSIGVSGTGGGFKKFGRGETDISNASRPIKDKEAKACEEAGTDYVELTVAFDGLAVVINPENDWAKELNVEELNKIWDPESQGKVLNWNQIKDGFPDQKLTLFGPGTASGTFDYFTKAVNGEEGACRGDYMPSEDDHVLVQGVAGDKGGLGFFGLAYYEENKDKLRLVAVDGGNGPIMPTMQTVKDGTYSPLSRPIFIYVSSKSVVRPEVVAFVRYYLENAADIVPDVGYIPLPDADYDAQLQKLDAFVAKHKG